VSSNDALLERFYELATRNGEDLSLISDPIILPVKRIGAKMDNRATPEDQHKAIQFMLDNLIQQGGIEPFVLLVAESDPLARGDILKIGRFDISIFPHVEIESQAMQLMTAETYRHWLLQKQANQLSTLMMKYSRPLPEYNKVTPERIEVLRRRWKISGTLDPVEIGILFAYIDAREEFIDTLHDNDE